MNGGFRVAAFDNASWSLAMALAWIAHRTRDAVESVARGCWTTTHSAIAELVAELRSGKLPARGLFAGEKIPHAIDPADWLVYEIQVDHQFFLGHGFFPTHGTPVVQFRKRSFSHADLLHVTLPAHVVKRLWPASTSKKPASARAEKQCRDHLFEFMQASPKHRPHTKANYLQESQGKFEGLSERGFARAWKDAIKSSGANWDTAGAPKKSRT
jgi:hypothetical protein